MSKMVGYSLVRVSGLENDADRQVRRTMQWRQLSASRAINEAGHAGGTAAWFADLESTGSESRAQELAMARNGIALDPPAGWEP